MTAQYTARYRAYRRIRRRYWASLVHDIIARYGVDWTGP